MSIIWNNVEQNSPEWFKMRLGIPTASNFSKIMAHYDKPTPKWGDPAITYARKIANEIVTGVRDTSSDFKNRNMERGNLFESTAVRFFEKDSFYKVDNGGFFHSKGDGYLPPCGDSPDGLISKKGCVEVKCVVPNTQWERLEKSGYDTSYKWQIQGHMLLGNRDWCMFVQYCPEMSEKNRLYTHRVTRDEVMINSLTRRLFDFDALIQSKVAIIR